MFSLYAGWSRSFGRAAALARNIRSSPMRLAKTGYLLVFSAILYLLLLPGPSHSQFRGTVPIHTPAIPAMPITGFVPTFTSTGFFPFGSTFSLTFSPVTFTTPPIPAINIPQIVGLPGPPLQFPLVNLTDTTGLFFSLGLLGGFGGLTPFFPPIGFGGLTPFFPPIGFGGLTPFFPPLGFTGFTGFTAFSTFTGLGGGFTSFVNFGSGFAGLGGFGGFAGLGGFAGKGLGGFNGRKPL
jgi:hypothetical protein